MRFWIISTKRCALQSKNYNQLKMKTIMMKTNITLPEKKVAIVWARACGKEQFVAQAINEQVEACRKYAIQHDIKVDRVFEAADERPNLGGVIIKEAINYVAKHPQINTILVMSYDRLSRVGTGSRVFLHFLKSKGVSVVSVTQPPYEDSVAGEFLKSVCDLYSTYENGFCKFIRRSPSWEKV